MSEEQVEHSVATHCYAYREQSGVIDVDSISESPEGVREKYLEACMGWRFNHPDRYSRDEEWARLLTFGSVVHVMVSLGEGECDAWKCESCDKVHPATAEMLNQYPMRELVIYAEQLGVQVTRNKPDMVTRLVESGKATICGSLGN